MTLNKKHIVFGVSVVLLLAAVAYRAMNPFEQARVDTLTYTGAGPGQGIAVLGSKAQGSAAQEGTASGGKYHMVKKTPEDPALRLADAFLNASPVSGAVHKDLFALYRSPETLQKEAQQPAGTDPAEKDTALPAEPEQVKDPLEEVRNYLTSYRIYGGFEGEQEKAVFMAKNKLVLVAREGDRLDGKYLIEDIGDTHIRITALDLNRTLHLNLRDFNNEE